MLLSIILETTYFFAKTLIMGSYYGVTYLISGNQQDNQLSNISLSSQYKYYCKVKNNYPNKSWIVVSSSDVLINSKDKYDCLKKLSEQNKDEGPFLLTQVNNEIQSYLL